jgi:hypothetical protein
MKKEEMGKESEILISFSFKNQLDASLKVKHRVTGNLIAEVTGTEKSTFKNAKHLFSK